jgi:hypothetical protein
LRGVMHETKDIIRLIMNDETGTYRDYVLNLEKVLRIELYFAGLDC